MPRFKLVAPPYSSCGGSSKHPVRVIDTESRTDGSADTVWRRAEGGRTRAQAVEFAAELVDKLNAAANDNPGASTHDIIAAVGWTPFRVTPKGDRFNVEYRADDGSWNWRASFLLESDAREYLAERVLV